MIIYMLRVCLSDWPKGRTYNAYVDLINYVLIVLDHLVEAEV
jgi:hypothetical protein